MRRLVAVSTLAAAAVATVLPVATAQERPVDHLQVLSINDLHGNLEPPPDSDTGGAAYLAAHLADLREGHPRSVTVGAGDLTGASPLISGFFHDAPTIAALGAMGLRYSAVGNHEFDHGVGALLQMARASTFEWLAANVVRTGSVKPILPPYALYRSGPIRLGFIGLTLQATPTVVSPGGTDGVRFGDEVQTINRYARELDEQGADGIFVLLHQGGAQGTAHPDPNGCTGLSGAILPIIHGLSDRVDVVASGHTHNAYVCRIDGKLVAAGGSYGRLVTDYDLSFDKRTHDLVDASAHNVEVTRDVAPDPAVQRIVDDYAARVQPVAARVVGTAAATISRTPNATGESALGDVIADAQRSATGADIALVNPGNIRTGVAAGAVTYGELYDAQPFGNDLAVKAFTGAQLRELLEEGVRGTRRVLQPSGGFAYAYTADGDVTSMTLAGAPVADDQTVSVAMNDFLASGGDRFAQATRAADRTGGPLDVDALVAYFASGNPVGPGPQDRITRAG